MSLKISQNSKENKWARASFLIKLQAKGTKTQKFKVGSEFSNLLNILFGLHNTAQKMKFSIKDFFSKFTEKILNGKLHFFVQWMITFKPYLFLIFIANIFWIPLTIFAVRVLLKLQGFYCKKIAIENNISNKTVWWQIPEKFKRIIFMYKVIYTSYILLI